MLSDDKLDTRYFQQIFEESVFALSEWSFFLLHFISVTILLYWEGHEVSLSIFQVLRAENKQRNYLSIRYATFLLNTELSPIDVTI